MQCRTDQLWRQERARTESFARLLWCLHINPDTRHHQSLLTTGQESAQTQILDVSIFPLFSSNKHWIGELYL